MPTRLDPARLPDATGHFGRFGGRFVPETLMSPLIELERALAAAAEQEARLGGDMTTLQALLESGQGDEAGLTDRLTACRVELATVAERVEALGREGDVLVGISTSGNSENVVQAFERARATGIRTIALTGASGGKLGALADIEINVPSSETSHVQEAHIAVGQLIAFLVEDELYPRP